MEQWIVVLAVMAVLSVGVVSGITIVEKPCDWAPFDENCYCEEGENKLVYPHSTPQYFCESKDLFLNPDDPNINVNSTLPAWFS